MQKNKFSKPYILICEDNPADVNLLEEALSYIGIEYELKTTENGEEIIQYISKLINTKDVRVPDLIILDLNLQRIHGTEVLKYIKQNEASKNIPVIIFTHSNSQSDIEKCYELKANCFITKPLDFKELLLIVKGIFNFYF